MERIVGRPGWTTEQIEFLQKNVGQMTFQQIAVSLPPPHHTRNAVIGKAARLGLAGNPDNKVLSYANRADAEVRIGKRTAKDVQEAKSQIMKVQRRKQAKMALAQTSMDDKLGGMGTFKLVEVVEIALDQPGLETRPVSLMDRRSDQCAWPLDSGMFCGNPIYQPEFGKTEYCAGHYRLSVRPHSEYRKPLRRRT